MKWDVSLFMLLCTVENMPLSFSLATASTQRLGFPLIYVNKFFEKLTGYSRSDVIGKSAKFLQIDLNGVRRIDEAAFERLAFGLRNACPTITRVTNYRCNGEKYVCMVALKPIYDEDGSYLYVASLQIELTDQSMLDPANYVIQSMMNAVPSRVVIAK